jgi:hypothetical protein
MLTPSCFATLLLLLPPAHRGTTLRTITHFTTSLVNLCHDSLCTRDAVMS